MTLHVITDGASHRPALDLAVYVSTAFQGEVHPVVLLGEQSAKTGAVGSLSALSAVTLFVASEEAVQESWFALEVGIASAGVHKAVILCVPPLASSALPAVFRGAIWLDKDCPEHLFQLIGLLSTSLGKPVTITGDALWRLAEDCAGKSAEPQAVAMAATNYKWDDQSLTEAAVAQMVRGLAGRETISKVDLEALCREAGVESERGKALLLKRGVFEEVEASESFLLLTSSREEIERRLQDPTRDSFMVRLHHFLTSPEPIPSEGLPGLSLYKSPAQAITMLLLVVVGSLMAVSGLSILKERFRAHNQTIKQREIVVDDSGLRPKVVSPFRPYAAAFDLAEDRSFSFCAEWNSEVVDELAESNAEILPLLENCKHESLFDLLEHLYLLGKNELLYKIVATWLSREGETLAKGDLSRLLDFIERTYLREANDCFEVARYDCAAMASRRAGGLVKLLNVSPGLGDPYLYRRINHILLAETLFYRSSHLFRNSAEAKELANFIAGWRWEREPEQATRLASIPDGSAFQGQRDYWRGLIEFRRRNFLDASVHFQNASRDVLNSPLVELSTLMLGRCLFWSKYYKQNEVATILASRFLRRPASGDANTLVNAMVLIQNRLKVESYRDDLDYYIGELKGFEDEPKEP